MSEAVRVVAAVAHVNDRAIDQIEQLAAPRSESRTCRLWRPTIAGAGSTMATLGTGVGPLRHAVTTPLVPAHGQTEGLAERLREADLRPRTSRDTAAAFFWNRLASRGIAVAVLGWPLHESEDERLVMELGHAKLAAIADAQQVSIPEAMLGGIRGGLEAQPGLRCIALHAWFRVAGQPGSGANAAPTITTDEAASQAESVMAWLDAAVEVSAARHLVAAVIGQRLGCFVVAGPRSAAVTAKQRLPLAFVPTVLDLLEEPPLAGMPGRSLLAAPKPPTAAGTPDPAARGVSPPAGDGGPARRPDFTQAIERARTGEGGPLLREVVLGHLSESCWTGLAEGDPEQAAIAARTLTEIAPTPQHLLQLGMTADLLGRTAEVVAAVERLRAESANGPLTELAQVLPSLGSSDEDVAEMLTRHPLPSLADPVARLVHATAAARLGRRDEAIEGLWGLITVGRAPAWSRRLYARLAVERNAPGDAQRATTALAFLSSRPAAWDP